MQTYTYEIGKPVEDRSFEDMCANVYGRIFGDALPTMNGRRGQAQGGVDVFVRSKEGGRVGIQCKRYQDGTLKLADVKTEVARADKAGTPIVRLIVATTATSDAKLIREVHSLSDTREAAGSFPVDVHFWQDICNLIHSNTSLQNDYAPLSPGAVFHRQDEARIGIAATLGRMEQQLATSMAPPTGLANSVDSHITRQLDGVNELLKSCRFHDAKESLERLGADQSIFDEHQKARWLVQRGICKWHLESEAAAAPDFIRAAEIYPDDEKMAAAGVRGLFLAGQIQDAVVAGDQALARFPLSAHVWIAAANAKTLNGHTFQIADAPSEMRDNCDVLSLVAWSRQRAGDRAEAVELSNRALKSTDAGFFTKGSALTLALQAAADDPVAAAFNQVEPRYRVALEEAVAAVTPRSTHLWKVQDVNTLDETLVHLGYAYLVLGKQQEALELVDEARIRDQLSPRMIRFAMEAYRRLDQIDDLVKVGRPWLEQLPEEALVTLAEGASVVGDIGLVEEILAWLPSLEGLSPEIEPMVKAMRWIGLWRNAASQPQALQEVTATDFTTVTGLALICAGARILHAAEKLDQASAAIERAQQLLTKDADSSARLLFADLLFSTDRLQEAARMYERLVVVGGHHSELHNKLLRCYVRTGEYRKARLLIESFPEGWMADDRAASLAIALGQETSDFDFLGPLAQARCDQYPEDASGWCLKLALDQRKRRMQAFHVTLAQVPDKLEGSPRQLAQIAAMECRYEYPERGMRRLYELYRKHMDDAEVASLFFTSILGGPPDLPFMNEFEESVGPGSWVRLRADDASIVDIAIDPEGFPALAQRDGFYSAAAPEVLPLLGTKHASSVSLKGPLNRTLTYTVEHLGSAFQFLLQHAQALAQSPLATKSSVFSVDIPKTEDGVDFSKMHAMLKQQKKHAQNAVNAYSNGPLTLGILSKLLHHNVVDVVSGWEPEGPALYVWSGRADEHQRCLEVLVNGQGTYVIDAATIAELVDLGCESALKALPKVYISNHSVECLQARLAESSSPREAGGRLYDDHGHLRFIEYSEGYQRQQQEYLQKLVDTALTFCETSPAYGPEVMPKDLVSARRVLSDEEHATLLLAAEKNAVLLTIDGRLADLAKVMLNLDRVWPQEAIHYGVFKNAVTPMQYVLATTRMFIRNRTFVSIGPLDLRFMCNQGASVLRDGLQRFKDYSATATADLGSAARVAFEFLDLLAKQPVDFKAYVELLSHIIEALCRHPDCDHDALRIRAATFIEEVARLDFDPIIMAWSTSQQRQPRLQQQREELNTALAQAIELAQTPNLGRPIRLSVLHCARAPLMVYEGT